MASKNKPIDKGTVQTLAALGFTIKEIAEWVETSPATIFRRCKREIRKGRLQRKAKVIEASHELVKQRHAGHIAFLMRTKYGYREQANVNVGVVAGQVIDDSDLDDEYEALLYQETLREQKSRPSKEDEQARLKDAQMRKLEEQYGAETAELLKDPKRGLKVLDMVERITGIYSPILSGDEDPETIRKESTAGAGEESTGEEKVKREDEEGSFGGPSGDEGSSPIEGSPEPSGQGASGAEEPGSAPAGGIPGARPDPIDPFDEAFNPRTPEG